MSIKKIYLAFCFFFFVSIYLQAQTAPPKNSDSIVNLHKKELLQEKDTNKIKKGWNFIPFPVVGYSTDFGFMFGAYASIWNFGDGAIYPNYYHMFTFLARYNTNVSGIFNMYYDSEYLIPKFRTNFQVSYLLDKMYSFYGVNGYESHYDKKRLNSYYGYLRSSFQLSGNLFGKIHENLQWATGLSYTYSSMSRGHAPKNEKTLYDYYVSEGILNSNEKGGGNNLNIKFGFLYDSRDFKVAPKKGMATEISFIGSPDFMNSEYSYLQLSINHRHFIPMFNKRVVLAYRIAYQGVIAGNMPFYALEDLQSFIFTRTYNNGLGGEATIRGMVPRRAMGQGIAWMNIEPRVHIVDFKFLRQDFEIHLNPFFDMGMVVQPFRESKIVNASAHIYSGKKEHLHCTWGIGGKLHVNKSFIATAEFGFPFNKEDGSFGLYLGTNYLF